MHLHVFMLVSLLVKIYFGSCYIRGSFLDYNFKSKLVFFACFPGLGEHRAATLDSHIPRLQLRDTVIR